MAARKLGLALGGGAARGWAHVGVIRALHEAGLRPDIVAGTSIGALVGAAYAAGELDRFEAWLRTLGVKEVLSFMDLGLSGGVLKGERVMDFFRRNFVDRPIEQLAMPYGAVATSLYGGTEVWLRQGSTVDAVRASIALPVLFTPVRRDGQMLVDGGLVNPVPVSLVRAMGADVVIAVDLNSDLLGRHLRREPRPAAPAPAAVGAGQDADAPEMPGSVPTELGAMLTDWRRRLGDGLEALMAPDAAAEPPLPSLLDMVATSINIMQVRITRSRMAGDPPDVTITPRLGAMDLLDFHRAAEAIEAGRHATLQALPALLGLKGEGG